MRRIALVALMLALSTLAACGGGTTTTGGGGTATGTGTVPTAPSTTGTGTVPVASCDPAEFLPVLKRAFDNEAQKLTVVRADVRRCRGGYAQVFAIPDPSVCEPGVRYCYDAEQVFLRAVDGRWTIITSGTGISCDTETTPAMVAACTALGLAPAATTELLVYFMRGEKLGAARRSVPRTAGVAAAAMRQLVAGPTSAEAAAGLGTSIPTGTRLRGVTIAAGVATVDLSARYASGGGSLSMFSRLGQVVYTLTQFPSVTSVRFSLDGKPVTEFSGEGIVLDRPQTRGDYEGVTPAILVERPAVGEIASLPLRVTGTANVFEAVVSYEVRDGTGAVLAHGTTMASCGTGCRGAFAQTIAVRPTTARGTLVMFEVSAKDGSRINVVRVPLRFAGG